MLLVFAVLAGLAGVWCLVAPPRAMLFGSRWQLRDGQDAEPSRLWVLVNRGSGVVWLVIAAVLVTVHFVTQGQGDSRESLKEAWGIGRYLPGDELAIDLDPEVQPVADVESTLAGYSGIEQGLTVWRAAVAGEDPVGDLGGDVADGDVVLAVWAGGCRPGPVLVEETDSTVTVSVTGVGFEVSGSPVVCGSAASRYGEPKAEDLLIVRVPLSAPLGDRKLITPDPPVRERDPAPIPGLPATNG